MQGKVGAKLTEDAFENGVFRHLPKMRRSSHSPRFVDKCFVRARGKGKKRRGRVEASGGNGCSFFSFCDAVCGSLHAVVPNFFGRDVPACVISLSIGWQPFKPLSLGPQTSNSLAGASNASTYPARPLSSSSGGAAAASSAPHWYRSKVPYTVLSGYVSAKQRAGGSRATNTTVAVRAPLFCLMEFIAFARAPFSIPPLRIHQRRRKSPPRNASLTILPRPCPPSLPRQRLPSSTHLVVPVPNAGHPYRSHSFDRSLGRQHGRTT